MASPLIAMWVPPKNHPKKADTMMTYLPVVVSVKADSAGLLPESDMRTSAFGDADQIGWAFSKLRLRERSTRRRKSSTQSSVVATLSTVAVVAVQQMFVVVFVVTVDSHAEQPDRGTAPRRRDGKNGQQYQPAIFHP
jgi:hypothetical protein